MGHRIKVFMQCQEAGLTVGDGSGIKIAICKGRIDVVQTGTIQIGMALTNI